MMQCRYSLLFLTLIISTHQQSIFDGLVKIIEEEEKQTVLEPQDAPFLYPAYDFIIVGAGTAGCVVANRLSENPEWKVLLIEAGSAENFLMDMPMLANNLQFTNANWKYKTVPNDRYCMGMNNCQCNLPRGKVVGGSSVLNYMVYTRGNRRDYDNWAKLGNEGWSFEDVLPYFKKIENFTIPDSPFPSYHNKGGYLTVSYAPYKSKLADAVIEASMQYGLPRVDYNGPVQVGVSRIQLSMKDGLRDSSSRAYLHPISNRLNLHVKKEAMVSKILIDPKTKQTEGVEFFRDGRKYVIRATKEVVVSAGAINSPQLLMLSGIGPRKHLTQKGIPIIANLKVGYNLMDHTALTGLTFLINKPYTMNTQNMTSVENIREYLNYHRGPLSVPIGSEVIAFQDLKNPKDLDGHPNIELIFSAGSFASDRLLGKTFGITDTLYDTIYKPIENFNTFTVFPILMKPKSRGRIMLKDNNYTSKPYIYPTYLANEEDMDTIIRGLRLVLNITKQPALHKLGTRLHDIPLPQCAKFEFGTDDYFKCMSRYLTISFYHLSGTCKMGPVSDREAVVDPMLRVYGVEGLRVIDASIMPKIPVAHTNSPTYMIAEKGSDMIKEDWSTKC